MEDSGNKINYEEFEKGENPGKVKHSSDYKSLRVVLFSVILGLIVFGIYSFIIRSQKTNPIKPRNLKSSKGLILDRINYIKSKYNIECPKPTEYIPKPQSVASIIDHTLLNQDATPEQVKKICKEAIKYQFAAVCVNEGYVALAHSELKNSNIAIASVVNFPLGNADTETKVYESLQAIKNGASEIDMVINCGWMKSGMYKETYEDIKKMSEAIHAKKALLKVIIEATCLEKDELIVDACLLSSAANADFVKTSTGFHKNGGAKVEHVKLMREAVGGKLGVKASGGIRDAKAAKAMIEAGATRLGASAGIKIVESLN